MAEALAEQARTLLHVSNLFGNVVGPGVAATLDRLIGGGVDRAGGQVFFTNSGAEANECAIKLARKWAGPGRHVVISAWDSFHGRTLATLHATGQPAKHAPFAPLPEGFEHVPYNDFDALDAACDPSRVAAVLLEPVQGEAGVIVPSSDYLTAVRALCDERGILLMADEVQTGLGRTGRWFGFQHTPVHARHRHHGQSPRQRRPHRRLLGPGRSGGRLRTGRPRLHLRRPAPGRGGGGGHPGRDGGRGRPRPGPSGPGPA